MYTTLQAASRINHVLHNDLVWPYDKFASDDRPPISATRFSAPKASVVIQQWKMDSHNALVRGAELLGAGSTTSGAAVRQQRRQTMDTSNPPARARIVDGTACGHTDAHARRRNALCRNGRQGTRATPLGGRPHDLTFVIKDRERRELRL